LQGQLGVYNEAQANLEKQIRERLVAHAELARLLYDKLSVEIALFNSHEISFNTNLSDPIKMRADFICKISPTLISNY
jgi:hypothetical protein